MNIAVVGAWVLLALIHATPALAFFRPAQLDSLYSIDADSPIFSLMHHRAALFLVIVVLCIWAALDPAVRRLAAVCVGISMIAFLAIYWRAGQPAALKTIAMVDLVGLLPLALVTWNAFRPSST